MNCILPIVTVGVSCIIITLLGCFQLYAEPLPLIGISGESLISLFLLLVSSVVLVLHFKRTKKALEDKERRFRLMAEESRKIQQEQEAVLNAVSEIVGYYDTCLRIVWANRAFLAMVGVTLEQVMGSHCYQVIHQRSEPCMDCPVQRALLTGKPQEEEMTFSNGSARLARAYPILDKDGEIAGVVDIAMDITNHKAMDQALRKSEARYRELADALPEVIFEMDTDGLLTYINRNAYPFFGYSFEDFQKGLNATEVIIPEERDRARKNLDRVLKGEFLGSKEYTVQRSDGTRFPVIIHASPIIRDGEPVGIRGIIIDITERKKAEEQFRYLSQRDPLTGFLNRAHFQRELDGLDAETDPVGIILCDVDGLKLVNDTMGHSTGDLMLVRTAQIIQECFPGHTVGRTGGDEFAVLFNDCSEMILEKASRQLQAAVDVHNRKNPHIPLSISMGYAVNTDSPVNPEELFKEADDNMFREKLHRSRSTRSALIQTLMQAQEERDYITEGHADRLQDLVAGLGAAIGLTEHKIMDLRLLAQFHDIGKVGIPDRILLKPGRLTPKEYAEMKRHCEIGYRIAQSSPELAPIAEGILKHHEWWNGKGYPLGLQGEEIPVACRILAIADAYDAMINDRPYRKALSHEEALAELQRCAGTQFDPRLVEEFMRLHSRPETRAVGR